MEIGNFPEKEFKLTMVKIAPVVKNLPDDAGDIRGTGSIPGLRRSPGGGNSNPPQYSCLENPVDRGACWAIVCRVTKSLTRLKRLRTQAHTKMIQDLRKRMEKMQEIFTRLV